MSGCQGPYVNGVNANANCPCWGCKCCPPPCCGSIYVHFECGSAPSDNNPDGCDCEPESTVAAVGFSRAMPRIAQIPSFDTVDTTTPIKWVYGQATTYCSIPCTTVTVTVSPAGTDGICCIEYIGESMRAVGSGNVTASASPSSGAAQCGLLIVKVNGQTPPVWVQDGGGIDVSLQATDGTCCPCCEIGRSNPCQAQAAAVFARRMARVGDQRIVLNRRAIAAEMLKRRAGKIKRRP